MGMGRWNVSVSTDFEVKVLPERYYDATIPALINIRGRQHEDLPTLENGGQPGAHCRDTPIPPSSAPARLWPRHS
jgi:hypothetical protein